MKLPEEITEELKKEVSGVLLPGDAVVSVGPVGLTDTIRMLETQKRQLAAFFSDRFLKDTEKLKSSFAGYRTAEELQREHPETDLSFVHSFLPMGRGGFLTALWKMAEASGVGLRIDLRSVPVCQQTIEIAEVLGRDPYKEDSHGACLIGTDHAELLLSLFRKRGIPAAVIGYALKSNDRLLYSQELVRYLDRPPVEFRKGENPCM